MVCAQAARFAKLELAGVVQLYLGGFSRRLFNVDELPKRIAVCCVTQVESTSSKVQIPTRAIPNLHSSGRDLMQGTLIIGLYNNIYDIKSG